MSNKKQMPFGHSVAACAINYFEVVFEMNLGFESFAAGRAIFFHADS